MAPTRDPGSQHSRPASEGAQQPAALSEVLCTAGATPALLKSNQDKTKMKQKPTKKNMQFVCIGQLLLGMGAAPGVWLIHPAMLFWGKTDFPFASGDQLQITSRLRLGPSQCWNLIWLEPVQVRPPVSVSLLCLKTLFPWSCSSPLALTIFLLFYIEP